MAIVAVMAVMQIVSATNVVTITDVKVNDYSRINSTLSIGVQAGDTLSVSVRFVANMDAKRAHVFARITSSEKTIEYTGNDFDLINGSDYTKDFSIKVPANIDPTEPAVLHITVESSNGDVSAKNIELKLQRDSFNVDVLAVNLPGMQFSAGSVIPVNVVLKNRGLHDLEDLFVTVKIDALGVSRTVYASDLTPVDSGDDNEDAVEKTIFLQIPSDAKSGVYSLEVSSSNVETQDSVTKSIVISGVVEASDVLVTTTSKSVKAGETTTYDLVIVNSGSRMKLYTLSVEAPADLSVIADQPLVSVPADSTSVVKVSVTPSKEGTYSFAVSINSDGNLVKKVALATTAGSKGITTASPTIVLTIVLAIIFIVLVIVLIILLTRKSGKTEELGESYY